MTPTRSLFGRSSLLATRLLNENQLRHFTTYLRLLADDLDFLARLDEMKRSGREYEQVRRLDPLIDRVRRLLEVLANTAASLPEE